MPSDHAYSGAELRTRDKAIEEKHQKEIRALEAKAERIRHAFDDRCNASHEYKKFTDKVAELLGFRTLDEVKIFLDIADEPMPYKGLAEHVERLEAELAAEKRDNQSLTDELLDVREERDLLKSNLVKERCGCSCHTTQFYS